MSLLKIKQSLCQWSQLYQSFIVQAPVRRKINYEEESQLHQRRQCTHRRCLILIRRFPLLRNSAYSNKRLQMKHYYNAMNSAFLRVIQMYPLRPRIISTFHGKVMQCCGKRGTRDAGTIASCPFSSFPYFRDRVCNEMSPSEAIF